MYSASFVSGGSTFVLGTANNIVFDISDLSGNDVELGLSQGTTQVGQTVERMAVSGNTLTIKGVIYDDVQTGKAALRHTFAPYKEGTLYLGDYYLYVVVKHSPTFSPIKDRGTFQLQLFAPYPFWRKTVANEYTMNHALTNNMVNNGDVDVPYSVTMHTWSNFAVNPVLTNTTTGEYIKYNGDLDPLDYTYGDGGVLAIYRDKNNIIRAEIQDWAGNPVEDVLSKIDEGSTLWNMHVGDNIIVASDDTGHYNEMEVIVKFNEAVGGVYEY